MPCEEWDSQEARLFGERLCQRTAEEWGIAQMKDFRRRKLAQRSKVSGSKWHRTSGISSTGPQNVLLCLILKRGQI